HMFSDAGGNRGKGNDAGSAKGSPNTSHVDSRDGTKVRNGNAEGAGDVPKVTKGYDVTPKYSTYDDRLKRTPVNKGEWDGERGESTFVSEKPGVKEYLDEAGVDGVEYKNAIPDFSLFTKAEVKIPNMTSDRRKNFAMADEILAKEWSTPEKKWTAGDIADWREDNNYTWHELNDLESMQLVPSKINGTYNHLGGVGEHKIKEKLGE
ncbi:HNH endonuclease, partial [Paenibacillus taichungensis]|uniref:HNH endonuclease n=1 Tax=Paenibacillus taichungensis TaxID=484184 RepID=UPI0015C60402